MTGAPAIGWTRTRQEKPPPSSPANSPGATAPVRPNAARWDCARSTASSIRAAVSAANSPPLPARNNPTSANEAIASATTTSSNVKPNAWPGRLRSMDSAGICDADPACQPVDTDRDAASPVADRDAATGRAAVRIEAYPAHLSVALLATDRQQSKAQLGRQLPYPPGAGLEPAAGKVDLKADRPIAQDRFRAGLAQSGGDLAGSGAQAESAAPGRPVSDDDCEAEAQNCEHDQQLDQREAGWPARACARRHRRRYRFTSRGH